MLSMNRSMLGLMVKERIGKLTSSRLSSTFL